MKPSGFSPNNVLLDSSGLQYAAWRTFLISITPNPNISKDLPKPVDYIETPAQVKLEKNPYRPKVWSSQSPNTFIQDEVGMVWYFDAVIRLEHHQSQRITQHPVQTGANITDHSYGLPAQLTMEIGMSDVMDSYEPSQWGSDQSEPTRSVMAYQTILQWKKYGAPLTITTRLDTYYNMVVSNISTPDDIKTLHGLKTMVTFQEVFVSTVDITKTTTRTHTVNSTKKDIISVPSNDSSKLSTILGG